MCYKSVDSFVPVDVLTDYKHIHSLKNLLIKVKDIFHEHNFEYWMCGGTTLGMAREGGIIPWDDDADFCFMEKDIPKLFELEPLFKKHKIGLVSWFGGYKLYDMEGQEISSQSLDISSEKNNVLFSSQEIEGKNFKYPFIDLFTMIENNDRVELKDTYSKELWPAEYYTFDELYPLKLYKFEGFELYGPNKYEAYLDRSYNNWKKSASKTYDHIKHVKTEKYDFDLDYNINKKPYLWQYWDNDKPGYINLCMRTVDKHCSKSFEIVRLNKDNIYKYLPELEKYKDKIKNLIIAHKVDIYRVLLLYKYGGLYLDADTVVLRDPIEIIHKLDKYDFVGFGCTGDKCTLGYGKPSNWILASRPTSILMSKVLKNQLEQIKYKNEFEYHDLGKLVIWDELKNLIENQNYEYFHYPNKIDGSRDKYGNWINHEVALSNQTIEYADENNMLFFVVYNSYFPESVKKMNEEEILKQNWNLTRFLRKSLLN